ncbi:MAG: ATP-binding protein, partial [Vicinamibacteria bacterium]
TALELLGSHWSRLVRSQLLHAQLPRIFAYALRARAALAAAAAGVVGSPERRRFLREAGKYTRRVEREKMQWSEGWVLLLRAGQTAETGEQNAAIELLERAENALEIASMPQFAAAARRRRGEILGGEVGSRLLVESDRWMRSQEVSNPARLADMLAPGGWRRLAQD